MMKLWLPARSMFNPTNSHRPLSSHTLHIRHINRFLISHPYLPRRKLWLNYPISTRQRSLHILYLSIHACRMRNILRHPGPSSTNPNTHTTRPILTRPIRGPR
uniref:Uncharacterized protein n=1 Tax=Panthera leo TaxID=9689 RepID=A0A8C8WBT5_PANLE